MLFICLQPSNSCHACTVWRRWSISSDFNNSRCPLYSRHVFQVSWFWGKAFINAMFVFRLILFFSLVLIFLFKIHQKYILLHILCWCCVMVMCCCEMRYCSKCSIVLTLLSRFEDCDQLSSSSRISVLHMISSPRSLFDLTRFRIREMARQVSGGKSIRPYIEAIPGLPTKMYPALMMRDDFDEFK